MGVHDFVQVHIFMMNAHHTQVLIHILKVKNFILFC